MKKVTVLFTDLDGTLTETITGKTFPEGIWDMKFKFDVFRQIKKMQPEYICVVSNQAGIGEFVSSNDFNVKFKYAGTSLKEFTGVKNVYGQYCASEDKNNIRRKPNTGMLKDFIETVTPNVPKSECLMLGDASGKPGDFSDSDLKTAENFGIDYIDVNDLLKLNL